MSRVVRRPTNRYANRNPREKGRWELERGKRRVRPICLSFSSLSLFLSVSYYELIGAWDAKVSAEYTTESKWKGRNFLLNVSLFQSENPDSSI